MADRSIYGEELIGIPYNADFAATVGGVRGIYRKAEHVNLGAGWHCLELTAGRSNRIIHSGEMTDIEYPAVRRPILNAALWGAIGWAVLIGAAAALFAIWAALSPAQAASMVKGPDGWWSYHPPHRIVKQVAPMVHAAREGRDYIVVKRLIDLKLHCVNSSEYLRGCYNKRTGMIYIISGLSRDVKRYTLEHEFAHKLGWDHP